MATKVKPDKIRRGQGKRTGRDRGELIPPGVNALMNREAVACVLQVSIRKLYEMVRAGEFPAADFPVGQNPRWTCETVNGWIDEQAAKARGE